MGSGEGDLWETDRHYCSALTLCHPHMDYNQPAQPLTQHSSEELTITCATQDRVEWGDGSLTLAGLGCV